MVKTSPNWNVTTFTNYGAKLIASLDAQAAASIVSAGIEASVEHITEGPVVSRSGKAFASNIASSAQDQCIFLKHYSVKHRWWGTKIEANAGPHQLPGRDGESRGPGVRVEDMDVEVVTEEDGSTEKVSMILGLQYHRAHKS